MFSGDRGINLRQEELLRQKRNNGIPEFEQKMNYQLPPQPDTSSHPPRRDSQQYQRPPPRAEPRRKSKPYVLYVWGSKEANSKRALNIVNNVDLNSIVSVVDVRRLDRSDIAPWLTGVPTLLSIADKSVFRGTKCLDEILDVGESFKRKRQQQKQFMQREEPPPKPPNIMMPQPQMIRGGDEPDISSLPSYKEPENESEKEKDDLKKQVEAIMARREAMIGGDKKEDKGEK